MMTILYIVLGVVIGLIILPVVGYFVIRFLLRRFVKKLGEALEGAGDGGVPPFRISLEASESTEWKNKELVEQTTAQLHQLGFANIGDYTSPEMFGFRICALANESTGSYAVLYDWDKPEIGVVMDLFCELTDDSAITCSNSPTQGLDHPPWETSRLIGKKIDEEGVVKQLAEIMAEEVSGRATKPVSGERFVGAFVNAYARKMDWQVERGGLQEEEIKRHILATNDMAEDEIPEGVVELTQSQWKTAIADFVSDKTRERFLRHVTKMSAGQWEDIRDRLYIVHERSLADRLVEELKYRLLDDVDDHEDDEADDDDEAYERRETEVETQLKPHFDSHPPRVAFEHAQALLPESQRYRRIARITAPWPADIYVEPEVS